MGLFELFFGKEPDRSEQLEDYHNKGQSDKSYNEPHSELDYVVETWTNCQETAKDKCKEFDEDREAYKKGWENTH